MIRRFDEILALKSSKTDLQNLATEVENKITMYDLEESERKTQVDLDDYSRKFKEFDHRFE